MNPYKVLEINENATPEEIKKAYHKLVKQYHPDRYVDNPLKNLAETKLKEINEAYDIITKNQNNSSSGNSYGHSNNSYGGSSSSYSSDPTFFNVRQLLNSQLIGQAQVALNAITNKNAEWHFLQGIIYLRQGFYDQAKQELSMAIAMDPGNVEYKTAFSSINNMNNKYYQKSYGGTNAGCCDACACLCCADSCCNCCGGDLISCC